MRLNEALPVFAAVLLWAAPLSAQSAFEQLEQQVQRDNARSAATQPAANPPGQEPGYLGVIAEDRQGGGKGLNVIEVIAGAPAEKSGLKAGDFITSIDSQPVHSMQDFQQILSVAPAGKKLVFQFARDGKTQTVEVTLGQRPPPGQRRFEQFGPIPATDGSAAAVEVRGATLGVRIASVTPDLQRSMALPSASGALVVAVVDGSAAAQAGIVPGNVILTVNGQRVDTPADLSRLIGQNTPGSEATIGYFNGTANVERKIVLGGAAAAPQSGAAGTPAFGAQPFLPGEGAGGLIPGQPPGGQFGAAPMPGQFGPLPGQPGGPGQLAPPGQYGGPGQFGNQAPAGVDALQMLEQRVQDLERRVRQLEQKQQQAPQQQPPAGGPKTTTSSNQQT